MDINTEEVGFLTKSLAGLGGAVMTVLTLGWNHTHSKIKELDGRKAEREIVKELHDSIIDLYDKRDEINDRMDKLIQQGHKRHIEILTAIGEINGKLSIVKEYQFQRPK